MLEEHSYIILTSLHVPKLIYRAHDPKNDPSPAFHKITQALQYY